MIAAVFRFRTTVLAGALLAGVVAAISPASASPPVTAKLGAALSRFAAEHPTYAGVVLGVRTPSFTWTGASGVNPLKSKAKLKDDAGFRIASVTKTFTAASTLRLVEQGRVELDDPIAKYLKPLTVAILRKGGYNPVAIHVRHLLTHTSGLYDYAEDSAFQQFVFTHGSHRWTRAEQLRFAMTHGKRYSPPGGQFHYSDTGYILLGELLEQVTGRGQAVAYRSLLRFNRLGLDETYLETLESRPAAAKARAHQYYETIDSTGFDPSFVLYGGGGLVSTVDDLTRFYRALVGGRVFDKAATLRTMLGKRNPRAVNELSMGIFPVQFAGEDCWAHSGFWGTTVADCPKSGVTLAINTNQGRGFDLPSQAFAATVLKLLR
jgi:D-alanyl-D-alanine carboxypeptidase